jgi:hypothetical protein
MTGQLHSYLDQPTIEKTPRHQQLLALLAIREDEECDVRAFTDCRYHNYRKRGIAFAFDLISNEFVLKAIHIYNKANRAKFEPFNYSTILPYGLTDRITFREIIQKFAPLEPLKGGGGRGNLDIWIRYPTQGIAFEIGTRDWNDGDATWTEMILTEI